MRTPEDDYWNTNQQWEHSAMHNGDFLQTERMKWDDMRTPMLWYAAEILAEKMMRM